MPFRVKLFLGFFVIVAMSGLATVGAIYSVSTLGRLAIDMYDKPLMAISFSRSAQSNFRAVQQAVAPLLGNPDAALSEQQFDDVEFDYETFVEDLGVVVERTDTERSHALAGETANLAAEFWGHVETIVDRTGDASAASAAISDLGARVEKKLELLVDYESENGYYFRQNAAETITLAWWINIGAALCILVFGLIVAFILGTRFSSAVHGMTVAMTDLASGDVSVEIPGVGRGDELGAMASALQVFKDSAIEKTLLEAEAEEARKQYEAELEAQGRIIGDSIGNVVSAAIAGDLSTRIDTADLSGVLELVSNGVNILLENVDRGVSETVNIMSALATGDLSRRMSGNYQGQFLQLKQDANLMGEQVALIADRIIAAAGTVQAATREIGTGMADLSSRTEHQASSLEETTASMEELTATVRQNANNAQEASQVARAAREAAANGGEIAAKAVVAMSRIEESSDRITDFVGLIQEIAFQTNLLALNAAVEAARAGEAGRGFAVVANEVRALAQRSGQASKDIKQLIVNSETNVREGVQLVNMAGESLDEIVHSVKSVADFVSDISAASQEQSSGIDQISQAISSVDEATQQNGALVEETTAALQSAQAQIEELRNVVTFFKTSENAGSEVRTERVA